MRVPTVSASGRRGWLGAATAVALAASAGGWIWWQSRQQTQSLSEAETQFWRQRFRQMDDAELAMSAFHGKPLVLNFWATWCPPCIDELPLLDAFYQQNKSNGWQVLGLAIDQKVAVERFLGQRPLSFPVALAAFQGVELGRTLGNAKGGLPFTVVFDAAGHVVMRKLGRLSAQEIQGFARWTT